MATNGRNVRQQSNRRRLVSGLALALIAAALTIPAAATARPIDVSSTGTAQADQTTAAAQDQGAVTLRRDGSKAVAGPTTAIPTAANSASGFDWGDAMIGAGGALTLVALIGLGGLSLRNRRHVAPAAPSTG
jgi:ABC-type phosphate transport system substrate-binding protein